MLVMLSGFVEPNVVLGNRFNKSAVFLCSISVFI